MQKSTQEELTSFINLPIQQEGIPFYLSKYFCFFLSSEVSRNFPSFQPFTSWPIHHLNLFSSLSFWGMGVEGLFQFNTEWNIFIHFNMTSNWFFEYRETTLYINLAAIYLTKFSCCFFQFSVNFLGFSTYPTIEPKYSSTVFQWEVSLCFDITHNSCF